MTQARRHQISLADTPYYHCINRCVRRAFLCGEDQVTGNSYEHRKQWIVDRLKGLSLVFGIDICAYAIMSNHYHVVLRVKPVVAGGWDAEEVVARWTQLFKGTELVDRYLAGSCGSVAERDVAEGVIEQWRERLFDISWFMRCLNEGIAREANREDGCKGRFWEGRFKSQALLDERALLACMAYVDLNPIRAGLSATPEESEFTSVRERMVAFSAGQADTLAADAACVAGSPALAQPGAIDADEQASAATPTSLKLAAKASLAPFVGGGGDLRETGLPFELADYLQLVDWTGRQWREDKRGAIDATVPSLLLRLNVSETNWIDTVRHFRGGFHDYVGPAEALQRRGESLGRRWLKGIRVCRALWDGATTGADELVPANAALPTPTPGA